MITPSDSLTYLLPVKQGSCYVGVANRFDHQRPVFQHRCLKQASNLHYTIPVPLPHFNKAAKVPRKIRFPGGIPPNTFPTAF